MTKNWARFPIEEPTGEDLSNFSAYKLYERSAIAGYGVLSGCVTTRSSSSAVAVSSGVYTISGVQAAFAGGSLTSIAAAAAGKQRYDLVYIDGTDSTLKLCAGVEEIPDVADDFLENYKPRPAEPTDTDWICLAVIRVTEAGIVATNFGTNTYATNSVANLYLSPAFAVDNSTLQVVDGVASVKPAYVKADGTVALSADWDAGGYEIRSLKFESDQTTGTAPLAVASTTVCTNLNADQVDGKDEAAFALLAGRSGGQTLNGGSGASENLTLSSTAHGTKGKVTTSDQIETTIATGTSPLAVSSTTKVTNLNADQVDGKDETAFALLAGRSGGQTLNGGSGASENLTLSSTAHGTKGKVTTSDQIETTIATGTSPFAVSSTTKVTNLNVDQVDGNHMDTTTTKGDVMVAPAAGDLDRLAVGSDGYVLEANSCETLGVGWGKFGWFKETNFTATPASTSTLTMGADRSGTIKVGCGLKYTIGGTVYYGMVTAITSNLLTIAGAPMGADVTALYWCDPSRVVQVDFLVGGTFADAANTALLASDVNTYFVWREAKAYCVQICHRVKTDDSGANQPRATISIAGAVVGTSNTNAGEAVAESDTATVVGINVSNYDINRGEAIEIVTDDNGSNDDASDLTVSAVFVLE